MSGACPGRIPRYPFLPGIWISSATSFTTIFSGVTISSWKVSAMQNRRQPSALGLQHNPFLTEARCPKSDLPFHLLCRFQHFFNRAFHVESLFRDVVVLTFGDSFEAFYSVGHFYVAAWRASELFGHVERLRQEALNLSRAGDADLLVFT